MHELPDRSAAPDRARVPDARGIGPLMLIGQLGWAVPGAASSTLLQAVIAQADPAHKVAVYTTFAVVGAITSALGTVVGGALSDRTRSRLGRRSPWLLASSVVAAVALTGTGVAPSLLAAGIAYAVFQAGIGVWVAALSALIPDRVAPGAVGRASAFAGLGYLLGQTIGGVVAGGTVTHPAAGLIAVPWVMVIAAVVIALALRGGDVPPARAHLDLLRGLIPPRTRDFWLAFAGRFLFILSIVVLTVFQLFTLTDYLHLSDATAGSVIGLATVIFGVLAAVAAIVTGPLSDRIERRKPFVIGAPVLIGIGLIPLLVAPSVTAYLVFFSITGIAFGTYISVDQALMVAVLPDPGSAARDLGFLSVGQTLPGVIAPIVGGLLATSLGYGAIFVASLVAALLAAVAIVGIRSVR
jgi:MFS family permease